jgi:hypothetical protein
VALNWLFPYPIQPPETPSRFATCASLCRGAPEGEQRLRQVAQVAREHGGNVECVGALRHELPLVLEVLRQLPHRRRVALSHAPGKQFAKNLKKTKKNLSKLRRMAFG